jgi:hypothetical protein
MRRRTFIALRGGAAAAWPLAVRAQQRGMRRIGVLTDLPSDDSEAQVRNAAFLQGLQELGWTVGRNLQIDFRWGKGRGAGPLREYAVELVALAPLVILAVGVSSVTAYSRQGGRCRWSSCRSPIRSGPASLRTWHGGRQHHWIHPARIWHQLEMAGVAQADCTAHHASSDLAGPQHSHGGRTSCRNPVSGSLAQGGFEPGGHARH